MKKLDQEEREILEAFDSGAVKRVANSKSELSETKSGYPRLQAFEILLGERRHSDPVPLGTFIVPPPQVSDMYKPEQRGIGRSVPTSIQVVQP